MLSRLSKLTCRMDELDEEIQRLCSKLGELTQERFVVSTAIRAEVDAQPLTYTILKRYES